MWGGRADNWVLGPQPLMRLTTLCMFAYIPLYVQTFAVPQGFIQCFTTPNVDLFFSLPLLVLLNSLPSQSTHSPPTPVRSTTGTYEIPITIIVSFNTSHSKYTLRRKPQNDVAQ
jgi:hypothetical protein